MPVARFEWRIAVLSTAAIGKLSPKATDEGHSDLKILGKILGTVLTDSLRAKELSESQIFIYQNDMDPVFMTGKSGNEELTADGIRGFAVNA